MYYIEKKLHFYLLKTVITVMTLEFAEGKLSFISYQSNTVSNKMSLVLSHEHVLQNLNAHWVLVEILLKLSRLPS